MKIRTLVDNNTLSGLRGEWGLSLLIEKQDYKELKDSERGRFHIN